MEKEFRIANYGVKYPKIRSIIEVEQAVTECLSVLLTDHKTAVYAKGDMLYQKCTETGEEKVFSRSSGSAPQLAAMDSVIALFNAEGKIRLLDYEGNRLSYIDTGNSALRALAFLSPNILCTGGESSKLMVFSICDSIKLAEKNYSEYVDSISANQKYLAVSLANGEIYIYRHTLREEQEIKMTRKEKMELTLQEISVWQVEQPCSLQFISEDVLFIGLSTGTGYLYSISESAVTGYSTMHSKRFTKIEVHGEYLITSSLDGRLRVSTHSLREVASLHAGSAINTFNALFSKSEAGQIRGIQYLLSTSTGNIIVYRDRTTASQPPAEEQIQKVGPHNIKEYTHADATEVRSLPIKLEEDHKRGKYARLMHTFQYRKALVSAIKTGNLETITGVMEYLYKMDRLIISLSFLTDEDIFLVAGISVDLLKHKEFFPVADAVLVYCTKILCSREKATDTPIYGIVERAVQETEEEFVVQSMLLETAEYIRGLLKPVKTVEI